MSVARGPHSILSGCVRIVLANNMHARVVSLVRVDFCDRTETPVSVPSERTPRAYCTAERSRRDTSRVRRGNKPSLYRSKKTAVNGGIFLNSNRLRAASYGLGSRRNPVWVDRSSPISTKLEKRAREAQEKGDRSNCIEMSTYFGTCCGVNERVQESHELVREPALIRLVPRSRSRTAS